jgi:hypothetical protein
MAILDRNALAMDALVVEGGRLLPPNRPQPRCQCGDSTSLANMAAASCTVRRYTLLTTDEGRLRSTLCAVSVNQCLTWLPTLRPGGPRWREEGARQTRRARRVVITAATWAAVTEGRAGKRETAMKNMVAGRGRCSGRTSLTVLAASGPLAWVWLHCWSCWCIAGCVSGCPEAN